MENNQTNEKLLAEIDRLKKELKKKKKYGLVWEDKPEDVVEMCKEKLPVLKEVKSKEIITDKNKPVNLLIEGDNYHALSVLNYTHKGKIDVIYIDPPYNTGAKDWKYNNDYVDGEDAFRHSKWLSSMNNRLQLAKNLLKDSSVIAVAIDDNEIASLVLLMDQIFGEDNRIGIICVQHHPRGRTQSNFFSTVHEYCLFYAKNKSKLTLDFCFESDRGEEVESLIRAREDATPELRPNLYYPIYFNPKTKKIDLEKRSKEDIEILPITSNGKRVWKLIKESFLEELNQGKIFVELNKDKYHVYRKIQRSNVNKAKTIWIESDYDANHHGTELLKKILNKPNPFPFPKSLYTLFDILYLLTKQNKEAVILDYFAGSGTTGHAVLELNKRIGGERKFILCTNNENNICEEVTYPRIQKVIEGYKNKKNGENIESLGGNLKYFKTDFVDYKESTDRNKIKLTKEAVEMLCVKEGTFELVMENEEFKIFKNQDHYAGIIFDQLAIKDFKKAIKNIKGKISVYIFSLGDDSFEDEFEDIKQKVKLSPIPEAILKVYRRIYK